MSCTPTKSWNIWKIKRNTIATIDTASVVCLVQKRKFYLYSRDCVGRLLFIHWIRFDWMQTLSKFICRRWGRRVRNTAELYCIIKMAGNFRQCQNCFGLVLWSGARYASILNSNRWISSEHMSNPQKDSPDIPSPAACLSKIHFKGG